ncbi:MAG: hypothetical protein KDD70_11785 [Bdellovibrionales bacterium]|nr:hypothetical protein [Bdellovibrionales bacterium]
MPYLSNLDKALKQIDRNQPAYLLVSQDRIRIEHLERRLLESLGFDSPQKSLFFGESLKPSDVSTVVDEVYSTGLFAEKQVIRLLNADEMKAGTLDAFLQAKLDHPSSNALLLHAAQLKANSRLRKYFKERKALLELKPIPEKELSAWTIAHGAALGVDIHGKVAALLVEIAEQSADQVDQLIRHIKLYCDPDRPPKTEDVLALFNHHPDPNEFKLLEQILTAPPHHAEKSIYELLDNGKNAFLILNLLGKSAARLLLIRSLLEKGLSEREVTQRIGGSPWILEKDLRLVKRVRPQKLLAFHEAVVTADSRLKGKSLGADIVFSQLIHAA